MSGDRPKHQAGGPPLLEVEGLEVTFAMRHGSLRALRGVDFSLRPGERLGIVGESGAGKSMAAFAVINLISPPGKITAGRISFEGRDLVDADLATLRQVRGDRIAMIFQDPMMTLNPVLTVGTQMVETLQAHRNITAARARELAIDKLGEVAIPSPETRFNNYPHELSGGLRQRVVIAIALLSDPAIIIADEPTTALDVTIQKEILALLLELCKNHSLGLILITHDLAVVSQVTQNVLVMYAGKVVESGPTGDVIRLPRHPYTAGLLAALPQRNEPGGRLNQIPGRMPSLDSVPAGCAFHPRCPHATDRCRAEAPTLHPVAGTFAACHHARELWREGALGETDFETGAGNG